MSYFRQGRGRPKSTSHEGPTAELLRKKMSLFGHAQTDSLFAYLHKNHLLTQEELKTAEYLAQLWQRYLWLSGCQLRRSSCSLFDALGKGGEPPESQLASLQKKLLRIKTECLLIHCRAFHLLKRLCLCEDNLYETLPQIHSQDLRLLRLTLNNLSKLFSS